MARVDIFSGTPRVSGDESLSDIGAHSILISEMGEGDKASHAWSQDENESEGSGEFESENEGDDEWETTDGSGNPQSLQQSSEPNLEAMVTNTREGELSLLKWPVGIFRLI
jgi:hypothetical protein